MKRLILFALPIALGLFAVMTAYAQNATFNAKDEFAQTSFEANGAGAGLSVFRGPDGSGGTQTFLDYSSFQANPDGSFTFTDGHGMIPNEAFRADTVQHFSLNADTSQIAGFQATTCTVSFSPTFTETCTDGTPEGPIQVDWQQSETSSIHSIEHLTSTSGPFTRKLDFDEDVSSADASGTFFGAAFSDRFFARIGKAHDSSITITRNN